ncbi:MAG TPA: GAF domain-containing protein, partial [Pelolinea sp.]|nr:GAF domain-containing protein [Pelolinea sp.]
PEEYHQEEKERIKLAIERGYSGLFEKEYILKDGRRISVEIDRYITRDASGKPEGAWAFVRDISERKSAEENLKRQLMEVTALRDVAAAGTNAQNLDELIEKVTETLGHTLYSDTFGINVYDKNRHWLLPHISYHGADFEDKNNGFSADQGITGRAVKTKKPQLVNDVSKNKDYHDSKIETRSELAVPVIVNGEVFGILNAESRQPDFFKEEDENLLSLIASQLATAVEKIQLREKQQQRTKELTALYETSLATSSLFDAQTLYERLYSQVKELFPLDAFLLALFDNQDESICMVYAMEDDQPLNELINHRYEKDDSGLMGWLMQNKQSLRFRDMTREKLPVESPQEGKPILSWMGVPLIIKGVVIGAISVQSFDAGVFTEDHQRLLESMAAQMAVALDNARLIEQTQKQIERLAALHDIDLVINSSLDLRVTLNILLDQVVEKLELDAAAVFLLNSQNQMLVYTAGRGFRKHGIEKYSLRMGEGISGQAAMERHLIQALNLDELDGSQVYASIMQEEGFESYYSVPLIAKGKVKGVLDVFNRTMLNPDQDWFNFLETLAGQAAIAIDNTTLLEDLHRTNVDLTLAYDTTLEGWSKALDMRDKETEGHTQRVAELSARIAQHMGIPDEEIIQIRRGALLHDIGKMGIPDSILLKPGPLDENEWKIMRTHSSRAYDLLYPIAYLRPALDVPLYHHEKFDGSGYPAGLAGSEIPLAARIFAIVDVWDALTSDRPYRKAWTEKKSLEYIRDQSGKHFDPRVVEVFLKLIKSELINGK